VTPAAQFWWLQTVLPGVGLLLLVLGVDRELGIALDAGIMILAAAGVSAGAATAALRRVVVPAPTRRLVLLTFTGPAAVCSGVALAILGLTAGAVGILHATGTSAAGLKALVIARPGLVLAPAGATLLSHGLSYVVGFPEGRDPKGGRFWNALLSAPARLGGLILVVLGVAALALGAWELASPAAFDRLVDALRRGSF
jgi:hypothetical protein